MVKEYQKDKNHEYAIAIKKNFAKEFYITVICPYQCKGKLTYYVSNYVHLNLNEHFDQKRKIYLCLCARDLYDRGHIGVHV